MAYEKKFNDPIQQAAYEDQMKQLESQYKEDQSDESSVYGSQQNPKKVDDSISLSKFLANKSLSAFGGIRQAGEQVARSIGLSKDDGTPTVNRTEQALKDLGWLQQSDAANERLAKNSSAFKEGHGNIFSDPLNLKLRDDIDKGAYAANLLGSASQVVPTAAAATAAAAGATALGAGAAGATIVGALAGGLIGGGTDSISNASEAAANYIDKYNKGGKDKEDVVNSTAFQNALKSGLSEKDALMKSAADIQSGSFYTQLPAYIATESMQLKGLGGKILGNTASKGILKEVPSAFVKEGIQESGTGVLSDIGAKYVAGGDKAVTIGEGSAENFLAGGLLGSGMHAGAHVAGEINRIAKENNDSKIKAPGGMGSEIDMDTAESIYDSANSGGALSSSLMHASEVESVRMKAEDAVGESSNLNADSINANEDISKNDFENQNKSGEAFESLTEGLRKIDISSSDDYSESGVRLHNADLDSFKKLSKDIGLKSFVSGRSFIFDGNNEESKNEAKAQASYDRAMSKIDRGIASDELVSSVLELPNVLNSVRDSIKQNTTVSVKRIVSKLDNKEISEREAIKYLMSISLSDSKASRYLSSVKMVDDKSNKTDALTAIKSSLKKILKDSIDSSKNNKIENNNGYVEVDPFKQEQVAATPVAEQPKQEQVDTTPVAEQPKQEQVAATPVVEQPKQEQVAATSVVEQPKQEQVAATSVVEQPKQEQVAATSVVEQPKQEQVAATPVVKKVEINEKVKSETKAYIVKSMARKSLATVAEKLGISAVVGNIARVGDSKHFEKSNTKVFAVYENGSITINANAFKGMSEEKINEKMAQVLIHEIAHMNFDKVQSAYGASTPAGLSAKLKRDFGKEYTDALNKVKSIDAYSTMDEMAIIDESVSFMVEGHALTSDLAESDMRNIYQKMFDMTKNMLIKSLNKLTFGVVGADHVAKESTERLKSGEANERINALVRDMLDNVAIKAGVAAKDHVDLLTTDKKQTVKSFKSLEEYILKTRGEWPVKMLRIDKPIDVLSNDTPFLGVIPNSVQESLNKLSDFIRESGIENSEKLLENFVNDSMYKTSNEFSKISYKDRINTMNKVFMLAVERKDDNAFRAMLDMGYNPLGNIDGKIPLVEAVSKGMASAIEYGENISEIANVYPGTKDAIVEISKMENSKGFMDGVVSSSSVQDFADLLDVDVSDLPDEVKGNPTLKDAMERIEKGNEYDVRSKDEARLSASDDYNLDLRKRSAVMKTLSQIKTASKDLLGNVRVPTAFLERTKYGRRFLSSLNFKNDIKDMITYQGIDGGNEIDDAISIVEKEGKDIRKSVELINATVNGHNINFNESSQDFKNRIMGLEKSKNANDREIYGIYKEDISDENLALRDSIINKYNNLSESEKKLIDISRARFGRLLRIETTSMYASSITKMMYKTMGDGCAKDSNEVVNRMLQMEKDGLSMSKIKDFAISKIMDLYKANIKKDTEERLSNMRKIISEMNVIIDKNNPSDFTKKTANKIIHGRTDEGFSNSAFTLYSEEDKKELSSKLDKVRRLRSKIEDGEFLTSSKDFNHLLSKINENESKNDLYKKYNEELKKGLSKIRDEVREKASTSANRTKKINEDFYKEYRKALSNAKKKIAEIAEKKQSEMKNRKEEFDIKKFKEENLAKYDSKLKIKMLDGRIPHDGMKQLYKIDSKGYQKRLMDKFELKLKEKLSKDLFNGKKASKGMKFEDDGPLSTFLSAARSMDNTSNRVEELLKSGYVPQKRFGRFTVTARDKDKNISMFARFETKAEADKAIKEFKANGQIEGYSSSVKKFSKEDRDAMSFSIGEISNTMSGMFSGAFDDDMIDSVAEKFASKDEDKYNEVHNILKEISAKIAYANSTAKNELKRKGMAGESFDLEQVYANAALRVSDTASNKLASFRMQRDLIYADSFKESDTSGDIDRIAKLYKYITDPKEEYSSARSVMYAFKIAGSIASAVWNLTSSVVSSVPYMLNSGIGYVKAMKSMAKNVFSSIRFVYANRNKYGKNIDVSMFDKDMQSLMKDMIESGKHTSGEAFNMRNVALGSSFSKFMKRDTKTGKLIKAAKGVMTNPFEWTETINRITAIGMAVDTFNEVKNSNGMIEVSKKGRGYTEPLEMNLNDFARDFVNMSQGDYSKTGRSGIERGIGAPITQFKHYPLTQIELFSAIGWKPRLVMLAHILALGGFMAMPMGKEMNNLIEAIAHSGIFGEKGKSFSVEKFARDNLGKEFMTNTLYRNGMLGLITDSSRMGISLSPELFHIFDANNKSIGKDFASILGPTVSSVYGVIDKNSYFDKAGIVSLSNAKKAYDIATKGEYRDSKGRLVKDANPITAAPAALLGFKTASSRDFRSEADYQVKVDEGFKAAKQSFSDRYVKAKINEDLEEMKKVKEDAREFEKSYGSKLNMNYMALNKRAKDANKDYNERVVKNISKGLRRDAKQSIIQSEEENDDAE